MPSRNFSKSRVEKSNLISFSDSRNIVLHLLFIVDKILFWESSRACDQNLPEDKIIKILLLEGSSIVLSNAFDASSVNDFTGGKITTLYLPSIGERLSLLITSLISSTP